MKLDDFIEKLANDVSKETPRTPPSRVTFSIFALVIVYGVVLQAVLGIQPEISWQLSSWIFVTEVGLLFLISLTSCTAVAYFAYPDLKQRVFPERFKYFVAGLVVLLLLLQGSYAAEYAEVEQVSPPHTIECSICILLAAILPAFLLSVVVKKGATTRPLGSAFAVAVGSCSFCALALRLAEDNNSVTHIFIWHYLPIVLVTVFAVLVGRRLFRWH